MMITLAITFLLFSAYYKNKKEKEDRVARSQVHEQIKDSPNYETFWKGLGY